MRLRNIPGADDVIRKHPIAIKNETEQKGQWNKVFGNDNPIHIEIGMGKGQFLLTLAKQNPNINYIGIERYSSVLLQLQESGCRRQLQIGRAFLHRIFVLKGLLLIDLQKRLQLRYNP